MRIPISARYALGAGAAIALLAGCSSGSSNAPSGSMLPQSVTRVAAQSVAPASWVPTSVLQAAQLPHQRPSWMIEARVVTNDLFAGEFGSASPPSGVGGGIFQYPAADKKNVAPKCSIETNGVNGIGMNATGTLYVPQSATSSIPAEITTYLPGCKQQALTLTGSSGQPADIAFDSKGNAYVSDIFGASGSTTPGLIDVYLPGKTTPARQLTNATVNEALGIAVDKLDNVYLAFLDSSGTGHVVKFLKGKGHGKVLNLTGLSRPIGLEFDGSQNLVVTDLGDIAELVYAPPYTGAPKSTLPDLGTPVEGKLNKLNTLLYVSDVANGAIDVYSYPTGKYQYSVTNGLGSTLNVEGVALDPENAN